MPPQDYLGPIIVAKRGTATRLKFFNKLGIGSAGNLFIPVDTTVMGAGPYNGVVVNGKTVSGNFTQNRASLHLHGGNTPWVSDGTPHQWLTPAGEAAAANYAKGLSFANVPDTWESVTGTPQDGVQTLYYTNDQSARLMFYHDHAYGITRLNVYAGEAAGYLLTDEVEQDLISRRILPGVGVPLIIQDKTFVNISNPCRWDTWMIPQTLTTPTTTPSRWTPGGPWTIRTPRLCRTAPSGSPTSISPTSCRRTA